MFKYPLLMVFLLSFNCLCSAQSTETKKSDSVSKIAVIERDMVFVQGDSFQMGSSIGFYDQQPVHTVKLQDFYIDKYEITQAQWNEILGNNPSQFGGCDSCPVENLSYGRVKDFIRRLNIITGKEYRLPTEAEWEFAARGGKQSKAYEYSGSNDLNLVGWFEGNSLNKTHPVGQKKSNELGIFDMSGNVAEWCSDYYNEFYYRDSTARNNPVGPTQTQATDPPSKLMRGGSWGAPAKYCTVTYRFASDDFYEFNGLGFRLARNK